MQIEVGAVLEGKVTGVTSFGVFVSLGENKTGMVHISEVSSSFVRDIKDFIKENDSVRVKVIAIDEKGKIALSIKQAAPETPKDPKKESASPVEYRAYQRPISQTGDAFEDMMSRFKVQSDEKLSEFKRAGEVRRGTGSRRK